MEWWETYQYVELEEIDWGSYESEFGYSHNH